MKLASNNQKVERSGVQSEGTFKINATSKAFDILSSGLYSDKIRAVIRELSCNAYDAHVAAGNQDTPFEIHLPNHLEPYFSVKDYGTGLSEEQVFGLYTTYFDSTKTDSNEFIGALGLGSKSPFSYSKSFEVMVRYNHELTTYSIFINEEGIPTVAKIGSMKTTEPNGLEVRMSVHARDFYSFKDKLSTTLMFFPIKPKVKGDPYFKFQELEPVSDFVQGEHWKAYKNMKPCVVQGNVRYDLDVELISEDLTQWEIDLLNKSPIVLFFDIGELEVSASRESLQYNKYTKANIRKKIKYLGDEVLASISKAINQHKGHLWDAFYEIEMLSYAIFGRKTTIRDSLQSNNPILGEYRKSKGMFVVQDTVLKYHKLVSRNHYNGRGKDYTPDFPDSYYRQYGRYSSVQPKVLPAKEVSISSDGQVVLHCTSKKGTFLAIKEFLGKLYQNGLVIQQTDFDPLNEKKVAREYKKLLAALGNPKKIVDAETLPAVVAKRKTGGYRRSTGYIVADDGTITPQNIDLNKGGYYFEIKKKRVVGYEDEKQRDFISDLADFVAYGKELGFKVKNAKLYGVTVLAIDEVKNDPNWVNIFDVIKAADKKWGELYELEKVIPEEFNKNVYSEIRRRIRKNSKFHKLHSECVTTLLEIKSNKGKLRNLTPFHESRKVTKNHVEEIRARYPLLHAVYYMEEHIAAIADYINLIDKE